MANEGPVFDERHKAESYAAPTRANDGKAVSAYFGVEGLYWYDLKGEFLWKYDPDRPGNVSGAGG